MFFLVALIFIVLVLHTISCQCFDSWPRGGTSWINDAVENIRSAPRIDCVNFCNLPFSCHLATPHKTCVGGCADPLFGIVEGRVFEISCCLARHPRVSLSRSIDKSNLLDSLGNVELNLRQSSLREPVELFTSQRYTLSPSSSSQPEAWTGPGPAKAMNARPRTATTTKDFVIYFLLFFDERFLLLLVSSREYPRGSLTTFSIYICT